MADKLKACLIYVAATRNQRAEVRAELEHAGYEVCEVEATLPQARAAKKGQADIPEAISKCIREADLCVFLLPESDSADELIGMSAGLANLLGKRIVGIVAGVRDQYPQPFETAGGMIRVGSERLRAVLGKEDLWEEPDKKVISDRKIKHQRCQ